MPNREAFVDERGVRWDTNEADYEGYLMKKSKWMGEWRKRYFILKGSKLFFSKSDSNAPHGLIDLVDCIHVKLAESKSKKRNAVEIMLKYETFLVYAETEIERDEWITQLGKSIVKYSSMHVSQEDEEIEANTG
eukprot:gene6509-8947_t